MPTVSYFYDNDIANIEYEKGHFMKPMRVAMTHDLVMQYGLHKKMVIYRPRRATDLEMTQFHSEDYIEFLKLVDPRNMHRANQSLDRYNFGDDCPVFEGLWDFCGISAGGSIEGASHLNRKKCEVAVNWAGGLHHAKKDYASGFCYVNDIVLGILELLRHHKRVLYIDIDVHHGDGVEEAFYTTDRVMTVSFHKFGQFFPCTGHLDDIGADAVDGKSTGKYYSVNVPLRNGINDFWYLKIFKQVIESVMQFYKPEAVVLQCGADSLSGDRIGPFNLSLEGHVACVKEVQRYNLPTLVLGGGGYTIKNVALTWAKETGTVLGVGDDMDKAIPCGRYYTYYSPYFELDVLPSNMANENSEKYLRKVVSTVVERLRNLAAVPSVQSQVIVNGLAADDAVEDARDDEDQDLNSDLRDTLHRRDKRVDHPNEIMDDDDDEDLSEQGFNIVRNMRKPLERNHMNQDIGKTSSTLQARFSPPEADYKDAAEALVQLSLSVPSGSQASSIAASVEDSNMRTTYPREQSHSNFSPSSHNAVLESELYSPQYNPHNQGPAPRNMKPDRPRRNKGKSAAIIDNPPQRASAPILNIKRNASTLPLAPTVAKKAFTYDSRGREVYDSIEVEQPYHQALRKDTRHNTRTRIEPAKDSQSPTPGARRRTLKKASSPLDRLVAVSRQPPVIEDAEAQQVLTPSVGSAPAPVDESPEEQSDEEEEDSQGSSYVPSE